MINSASKCLKITLKVIKFSKPETKFPKKLKLRGIYPLESFEGGLIPLWQKPCMKNEHFMFSEPAFIFDFFTCMSRAPLIYA
jgi:hypothetical protein